MRTFLTVLIIFFVGVVALFFLAISAVEYREESLLQREGINVRATVTDAHIIQKRSAVYELKYKFQPSGKNEWYTCVDSLRTKNGWCGVPKQEWETARSTNGIEIIYLPRDPWINRPVSNPPTITALLATGLGFGVATLGLLILYLVKGPFPL